MNALETMRADVKHKTLQMVNQFREEAGLKRLKELPKGKPNNSDCCVIANALDVRVLSLSIEPKDDKMYEVFKAHSTHFWDDTNFHIPDELFDFIYLFDEGDFPELIEDAK